MGCRESCSGDMIKARRGQARIVTNIHAKWPGRVAGCFCVDRTGLHPQTRTASQNVVAKRRPQMNAEDEDPPRFPRLVTVRARVDIFVTVHGFELAQL